MLRFKLAGDAVMVSDLHITGLSDRRRLGAIGTYIRRNRVKNLVVLGDTYELPSIADGLSGVRKSALIENTLRILGVDPKIDSLSVLFFVASQGHDPQNLEFNEQIARVAVQTVGKKALLEIGSLKVFGTHGDVVPNGYFACAISYLFHSPMYERMVKRILKIPEDWWLLMGHTHVPGLDQEKRIANPGGWKHIPLLRVKTGCGVLARDDRLFLVRIG